TEEQYEIIDQLEDNPRCLFEGAAGTGKTLLALEFSRRTELAGKRVLLVCYNQLLSQRFGEWAEGTGITAGTFHGVVESLVISSRWKQEFLERKSELGDDQKKLFGEVYPFYGEMALEELGPQFDLLVMDEAQDLCRKEVLEVLDGAIRGGLSGGRWAIFGDFSRQNIYNHDENKNPLDALGEYCRHPARSRLTRNCRNTRRIAEETCLLSGFENQPSRLAENQGPPVEYEYWRTSADFLGLIEKKIRGLLQGGVSLEDIVILSPRRLQSSELADVKRVCGFLIEDASRSLDAMRKKKVVKFSTIHSFKGLESRVVIVVDIEEVRGSRAQSLLYVSMSRAKSLLILIINEQARKSIDVIRESRGRTVSV
ncbi:MAG: ATP-binding domain-containing protein, partial [Candidatus Dadabacteria bacterium]|nr:ATP-binding domain-containing protein [Candidatus Dadabacteria bacterium]